MSRAPATDRPFLVPRVFRWNLWFGGIVVGMTFAVAILSMFWTPHRITGVNIRARLQGPSWGHWLGTDAFGRDILSLLMAGAQNALFIGAASVLLALVVGVTLGLIAAARGGWLEEAIMRASDFVFSFPTVLSAIMLAAIWGPGSLNSVVAIGIASIPIFARVARGSAKSIWAREFVMAARASGKGQWAISVRHVLPNIVNIIVVQATITFAVAILADAALSFLGLGTPPPAPSWGRMLKEAQTVMIDNPHVAIFPGLAIAFVVLALNLLGDGLRDLLDPRFASER
ncbi:ABC transporter permease [Enterovirga sp.]|uniref:ABC transporter permease n=1 Tax=Enterovirga sp. TaxID=2026350 RepID=UPI002B9F1E40|nr:ABC transporter permease [Enterovirga sp.]HMO27710.1 ABC transporter permease [Enterovirga sp.]